jgi:hypothetical protein
VRPAHAGLLAILTTAGMVGIYSVVVGPCSTSPTHSPLLLVSVEPEPVRVGPARLAIDVRCACEFESINGPTYSFRIEGADVEVVDPPKFDPGTELYYANLRFAKPGEHTIEVDVTEPGEEEAFRWTSEVVRVLPREDG